MTGGPSNDRSEICGSRARGGQFYRRAGARLTEEQDESVVNLSGGDAPKGLHEGFHAFDKAHLVMLAEQGLVPGTAASKMLSALREMEEEGVVELREATGHGPHAGEAYLIEALGESVGGHIHLARSSHDLANVAIRYVLRRKLLDLLDACFDLVRVYTDRAAEYTEAVVPTYTGLQHAQVATFGFYLIGWAQPIRRDTERVLELYDRVNTSPAGAAVGTTSDFSIDRERTADLLGFDGLLGNGEDVDKSFDVTLECSTAVATLMANLGQAGDQLLVWYSREFDLVDMPDRFAGTSSIMPQKKNPHTIEGVQRDTNGVIGEVADVFVGAKNLGGGCRISFDAIDTAVSTVETWAAFVEHLTFDTDRAEQLVYRDWALATDIAGTLVREAGLPWRTAHQITAILVRQSIEADRSVREVTSEHIDSAAREYLGEALDIAESTLDEVIDAHRAIEARSDVPGSPAPEQVSEQIQETREIVTRGRSEVASRRQTLEAAETRLEAAVDDIVE